MTTTSTQFDSDKIGQSSAENKNGLEINNKSSGHQPDAVRKIESVNFETVFGKNIKPHEIMLMQAEQRNRYQMKG
jgi:hypothetical protein